MHAAAHAVGKGSNPRLDVSLFVFCHLSTQACRVLMGSGFDCLSALFENLRSMKLCDDNQETLACLVSQTGQYLSYQAVKCGVMRMIPVKEQHMPA